MDFLNLILKPEINQQIGGLILGFVFNEIIKNKSKFLSYIINWIFQIFPWRNFNGILYINFSKTAKNMTDKTKQFRSDNFKIIKRTNYKCFDKNSGEINSKDLLIEVHNKHSILLQKISEKLLKINELVYAGFPHIPFGVLDGYKLKQTENVRFLEYLKSNNSSQKKIIELDKKYNMPIKIISTPLIDCNLSEEIILKIENSFAIKDNEINKISKNAKILKFSNKNIKPQNISNYAEIDSFKKQLSIYLQGIADSKKVKKIHMVATTQTSLSFSIGNTIEHYFPEIIVYNYNLGDFDWGISIQKNELIIL